MAGRIVLFGATGYTGGLIARRRVGAGVAPVLAGRDRERLDALAADVGGGVQVVKADVLRQNSVFSLVEAGDVLVSTVGPFVKHGAVAVRAAIAAGATYLDSAGEPAFIRRVFGDWGPAAERSGARLLPAQGYDYVPGALAGALALEAAGDEAVRVDVGYFAGGGGGAAAASPGTKESMVGALLDSGHAWRDGRLVLERGAARARTFHVRGSERGAVSLGGAEHFTLPAAYPRLRDVNVYLGIGALAGALQAGSLATSVVSRLPGTRTVMQFAGERFMSLLPSRSGSDEGAMGTTVIGAAYDGAGRRLSEITLGGGDPYAFTAAFMAWGARRAAAGEVAGAGALSPVTAYGLDALREGVEQAGFSVAGA